MYKGHKKDKGCIQMGLASASALKSTESSQDPLHKPALLSLNDIRWHDIVDTHLSAVETRRHQHAIHVHLNHTTTTLGIGFFHPYNGWWCFNSDLSRQEVHTAAKHRVATLQMFLRDILKDECLVLYKPNALELLFDADSSRNERGEWILSFNCIVRTEAERGPSTFARISKLFHTCSVGAEGVRCVLVEYPTSTNV